jgi:hypothetical protein
MAGCIKAVPLAEGAIAGADPVDTAWAVVGTTIVRTPSTDGVTAGIVAWSI